MVENALGRSVSHIFEQSGEEAFRRAETLALQRLLLIPDSVVATGGGAVLREENWDYMRASGLVCYLKVSPEESLRRTEGDMNRPLLNAPDRLARLRDLLIARASWYERAEVCIEAEGRPAVEVVRELVSRYQAWKSGGLIHSDEPHETS